MITPGFNIFKYIQAHLLSCLEVGTMDQFRFLFHSYVVPTSKNSTGSQFVYRHVGCPGQNVLFVFSYYTEASF
jgi:hypothetical protein